MFSTDMGKKAARSEEEAAFCLCPAENLNNKLMTT